MKDQTAPQCIACGRTTAQIPLINLSYKNDSYWICPQHLPILIHDPTQLTGRLPGAEGMTPADHHD